MKVNIQRFRINVKSEGVECIYADTKYSGAPSNWRVVGIIGGRCGNFLKINRQGARVHVDSGKAEFKYMSRSYFYTFCLVLRSLMNIMLNRK